MGAHPPRTTRTAPPGADRRRFRSAGSGSRADRRGSAARRAPRDRRHARTALARGRRARGPGLPRLPRLTIIVAAADGARLYAALETAMAAVALGHPARLFLQGEAAGLLRVPIGCAGDADRKSTRLHSSH